MSYVLNCDLQMIQLAILNVHVDVDTLHPMQLSIEPTHTTVS